MNESQEIKKSKLLHEEMLTRIEFLIGVILDPRIRTESQRSKMMEVIKEFCNVLKRADLQAHSTEIIIGLDQLDRSLSSYHDVRSIDFDEISKHLSEATAHFAVQRKKAAP